MQIWRPGAHGLRVGAPPSARFAPPLADRWSARALLWGGRAVPAPRPISFTLVACATLFLATGCKRDQPQQLQPRPVGSAHEVSVNRPAKLTSIETGRTDPMGNPARVACVTCHTTRHRDDLPATTAELKQFHSGLQLKHGSLSCGSCHQPGRAFDTLHLADGRSVEMAEVMSLCGQCHGPQRRNYEHGSHGGMNGHWDLQRGPRARNTCVDCHDPHAPAFPAAMPVLPPRDRYLPHPPATNAEEHPHG